MLKTWGKNAMSKLVKTLVEKNSRNIYKKKKKTEKLHKKIQENDVHSN